MFILFKPKPTQNTIQMNVAGINPETENEFLFYDFVEKTPNYILEPWLKNAKEVGYQIKPNYDLAIIEKLNKQYFKNPYSFPEYFDNSFEYIAIDFETANNNRISACAIGLTFVKNNTIVFSKKYFINPPETERFKKFHTGIHGIVKDDVANSMSFGELWNYEFSKYFNNNLIVFHNASMELAILKNLFKYYSIEPYNISYLDTMLLAGKLGYSTRLVDLANKFNIEIKNHHDPESDSEMCALIFGELTDRCTNYREYIKQIDSNPKVHLPIRTLPRKKFSKRTSII